MKLNKKKYSVHISFLGIINLNPWTLQTILIYQMKEFFSKYLLQISKYKVLY